MNEKRSDEKVSCSDEPWGNQGKNGKKISEMNSDKFPLKHALKCVVHAFTLLIL